MVGMKLSLYILIVLLPLLFFTPKAHAQTIKPACLWEICSVDTMKMSRDRARENANNPAYDTEISRQLQDVKDTEATHVAIGTAYDEEFVPYLKRWVAIARQKGLKVWFRGNWSSWEGWFDHAKTMTPQEHITQTATFIKTHPELFENGDIFDACPECEGSGKWPQTAKDQEYRDFIKQQHASSSAAFAAIGKKVRTDLPTMIGGHAKDVMDQATINDLNKTVSIDHYVKDRANMKLYIDYFRDTFGAKTMVSEFGAPIPDINGDMTEDQQAAYVNEILQELYKQKSSVVGLNYFVLNDGSTELENMDGSKRKVYDILKSYFSPMTIKGTVTNTLGDPLKDIQISASDGAQIKTDRNGKYELVVPAQPLTLSINSTVYPSTSSAVAVPASREAVIKDFQLRPLKPDAIYQIREYLQKMKLAKFRNH
jgi:hypothetical protein